MKKVRKDELTGITKKVTTGCGALYVTVNFDEGKAFELFARLGKSGGCSSAICDSVGRLISLSLQHDIELADIIKQLKGVTCHSKSLVGKEEDHSASCIDGIVKCLEWAIKKMGEKK